MVKNKTLYSVDFDVFVIKRYIITYTMAMVKKRTGRDGILVKVSR